MRTGPWRLRPRVQPISRAACRYHSARHGGVPSPSISTSARWVTTGSIDGRSGSRFAVDDGGQLRQIMVIRPVLGGEQHGGRAVRKRRGVACRHGGRRAQVLAEDGLEGGELLEARVGPQVGVAGEAAVGGEQVIEEYNRGDMVKAQVLDVDIDKERISLGIKQLGKDAVGEASTSGELRKNAVVTCEVTGIKDGGLEVRLVESGIETFIKRSDLSRDRDEQRPERFVVGQKVDARIIAFDKKTRKLQVSIKALEIAEEKEAVAQYGSTDSGASLGDILGAALKNRNN